MQRVSSSLQLILAKDFCYTADNPLAVRKSADVFVRQARAFDEGQMEMRLPPLWTAGYKLITNPLLNTGIRAAPVVHRKNARVCIVDKLSGFSMPIFKMVTERGTLVFKVHEKDELTGVTTVELEELLATARAPGGDVVISSRAFLCVGVFLSR